ncbi:hypothetical protein BHM03_00034538 [Ensete ventricosum]|nr:hypothetical protein BHM03_00034538 [Ensete ventricosum]
MVRGREILAALLDHPVVLSSSDHLKGTPEKKVSSAERPPLGRLVYVFQREYATVDPALVQVDTSSNSIMPASFDRSSRGPDEIVRRIRVSLSSDDSNWKGRASGGPHNFISTPNMLCCAVCTAPYALVEEMRAPTRLSPTTLSSQDASSCLSREGGRETKM